MYYADDFCITSSLLLLYGKFLYKQPEMGCYMEKSVKYAFDDNIQILKLYMRSSPPRKLLDVAREVIRLKR